MAELRHTRSGLPFYTTGSDTQLSRDDWNEAVDALDTEFAMYGQGTRALRPAAGKAGRYYWATDEKAVYYDDGATWTSVVAELTGWAMDVTSGSYGWPATAQFGSWRRTGKTVEAMASCSMNANPPGTSTGALTFSLPPGVSVAPGVFLGVCTVGLPGGGVAYHGYAVSGGSDRGVLHSFGTAVTITPANGYTVTVDLRFTAS